MLKEKISNRTAEFAVVGLGYVGLPLAVEFAKVGIHTTGFEVNPSKVEQLMRGESYIEDVPSSELAPLVEKGSFTATTGQSYLIRVGMWSSTTTNRAAGDVTVPAQHVRPFAAASKLRRQKRGLTPL